MYKVIFVNVTNGELVADDIGKVKTIKGFWNDSKHVRKECVQVSGQKFHKFNLIVGNMENGMGFAFVKC